MKLNVGGMRVFHSPDFLAELNDFLGQIVLFHKAFFDEFGYDGVCLHEFKCLSFEIYR